jgi:hypothetical protein
MGAGLSRRFAGNRGFSSQAAAELLQQGGSRAPLVGR